MKTKSPRKPKIKSTPSFSKRRNWLDKELVASAHPLTTTKFTPAAAGAGAKAAPAVKARPVLVAEGDSWFDYPPGTDILDWLQDFGFEIQKVARAGATVEEMVYGPDDDTGIGDGFRRDPSQIAETIRYVREHRPAAVVFSGGGNDIVGGTFESFLNAKNAGGDPLRMVVVNDFFYNTLAAGYRTFLRHVAAEAKEQGRRIPVVGHGYDYAVPDGRGVVNVVGFHFLGPWLQPTLNRKGYNLLEGTTIVHRLIDVMNDMQKSLAKEKEFANVYFPVDVRGTLKSQAEWANEYHPTSNGFGKISQPIYQKLKSLGI